MPSLLVLCALAAALAIAGCGSGSSGRTGRAGDSGGIPSGATGPAVGSSQLSRSAGSGSQRAGGGAPRVAAGPSGGVSVQARGNEAENQYMARIQRELQRAREGRGALGGGRRQPAGSRQAAFRAAKLVCGSGLSGSLAANGDPRSVARSYARAWPSKSRQAAYTGCLAALRRSRR